MKLDLKRHKLLKLLADNAIKFEVGELPHNRPMGVSFYDLSIKMKCDVYKLHVIAAELLKNEEISGHDEFNVVGFSCYKNGLTSFSNNKYKARYWKDFWNNLFTISQIIVPILALVITLVTIIMSMQTKEHTEEILLLRKELNTQQELLNSQTNKIQNLYETILENNSVYVEKIDSSFIN